MLTSCAKDKEAKGRVSLASTVDISIIEARGLNSKSQKRDNCILLSVKSKNLDYVLDAQTEVEMKSWIQAIKQVLVTRSSIDIKYSST